MDKGSGRRFAALATAMALVLSGCSAAEDDAAGPGALPEIDVGRLYVTGISSGGYMATQLQVAHSSRFAGAAILAAGPYWCAANNVGVALASCTDADVPTVLPVIYRVTDRYARQGRIDATANLAASRTFLFHGTQDPTVARPVSDDLAEFYRHYDVPLTYRTDVAAGHGWLSPLGPVPCAETDPPYLNDCSPYDAQADLLGTMFGSVAAPNPGEPRGTLTPFDQNRYAVDPRLGVGDVTRSGADAVGMGDTGYLYTPESCAGGAECRVVVALHGCRQTADQIGDLFARDSGLNAYADTNDFVVLYPQARPDVRFGNPRGCWDWWGYLGPRDVDYANQRGPQVRTVMNMVDALGG